MPFDVTPQMGLTTILGSALARSRQRRDENRLRKQQLEDQSSQRDYAMGLMREQAGLAEQRDIRSDERRAEFEREKREKGGGGKTEDEIAKILDSIFPGITPQARMKILATWDGNQPLYQVGIRLYPNGYPLQPKEYKPDKPEEPKMQATMSPEQVRDSTRQIVGSWQKWRNNQSMTPGSSAQPSPGAIPPPEGLDPSGLDDAEAAEFVARGFTPEQAGRFIQADKNAFEFAQGVGKSMDEKSLNQARFRQLAEAMGKKLITVPRSIHEAFLLATQEGWTDEEVVQLLSQYFGQIRQGALTNAQ